MWPPFDSPVNRRHGTEKDISFIASPQGLYICCLLSHPSVGLLLHLVLYFYHSEKFVIEIASNSLSFVVLVISVCITGSSLYFLYTLLVVSLLNIFM